MSRADDRTLDRKRMAPNSAQTQRSKHPSSPNCSAVVDPPVNLKEYAEGLIELSERSSETYKQGLENPLLQTRDEVASSLLNSASYPFFKPGDNWVPLVQSYNEGPNVHDFDSQTLGSEKNSTKRKTTESFVHVSEVDESNLEDTESFLQSLIFPQIQQSKQSEDSFNTNVGSLNFRHATPVCVETTKDQQSLALSYPTRILTTHQTRLPFLANSEANSSFSKLLLESFPKPDLAYKPSGSSFEKGLTHSVSQSDSKPQSWNFLKAHNVEHDLSKLVPSILPIDEIDVLSSYDFDNDTDIHIPEHVQTISAKTAIDPDRQQLHTEKSAERITDMVSARAPGSTATVVPDSFQRNISSDIIPKPPTSLWQSTDTSIFTSQNVVQSADRLQTFPRTYGVDERQSTYEFSSHKQQTYIPHSVIVRQKPYLVRSSSDPISHTQFKRRNSEQNSVPKFQHQLSLPCSQEYSLNPDSHCTTPGNAKNQRVQGIAGSQFESTTTNNLQVFENRNQPFNLPPLAPTDTSLHKIYPSATSDFFNNSLVSSSFASIPQSSNTFQHRSFSSDIPLSKLEITCKSQLSSHPVSPSMLSLNESADDKTGTSSFHHTHQTLFPKMIVSSFKSLPNQNLEEILQRNKDQTELSEFRNTHSQNQQPQSAPHNESKTSALATASVPQRYLRDRSSPLYDNPYSQPSSINTSNLHFLDAEQASLVPSRPFKRQSTKPSSFSRGRDSSSSAIAVTWATQNSPTLCSVSKQCRKDITSKNIVQSTTSTYCSYVDAFAKFCTSSIPPNAFYTEHKESTFNFPSDVTVCTSSTSSSASYTAFKESTSNFLPDVCLNNLNLETNISIDQNTSSAISTAGVASSTSFSEVSYQISHTSNKEVPCLSFQDESNFVSGLDESAQKLHEGKAEKTTLGDTPFTKPEHDRPHSIQLTVCKERTLPVKPEIRATLRTKLFTQYSQKKKGMMGKSQYGIMRTTTPSSFGDSCSQDQNSSNSYQTDSLSKAEALKKRTKKRTVPNYSSHCDIKSKPCVETNPKSKEASSSASFNAADFDKETELHQGDESTSSEVCKSEKGKTSEKQSDDFTAQREKNRLASRASRIKRQMKLEKLLLETQRLEQKQSRIKADIEKMSAEKRKLQEMLDRHEPHWGVAGAVDSGPVLRSAGTPLTRVRALPPAP
ncbi:basic leucine zipper transcriptional factor atf-like [Plakobranchus ocellatus]|uniref:Basic leucine zipper transcriptional factor atf-like n=1 Tax=Plakobranchus ocellatus TaxID=259542 RepID=A0AAV3YI69_9GAST|nr:basic leucine zipper transcriptional factor atf-like [Plakobranchus ocellatus]